MIKLTFYVKHRIRALTSLYFDTKEDCRVFVEDMQHQKFIVCSDCIINVAEVRYVKIRVVKA